MKGKSLGFTAVILLLAAGMNAAQDSAPVANPVSTTIKLIEARFAKNLIGAAESMPADKYGYKPTPEMNSFGHVVMHVAQSNNLLCSKASGIAAPETKVSDTDSKDALVSALKVSFDFCSTALAATDDSKLGEQVQLFGGKNSPKAAALIALSSGWNDHYSALAIYLRLNGILPPSAQPAKQ